MRVWLAIACMFGLLERRFLVLRSLPCCMVGMRKSLRIQGSSGEEDHSGAFWFPAFLRFALLSNNPLTRFDWSNAALEELESHLVVGGTWQFAMPPPPCTVDATRAGCV